MKGQNSANPTDPWNYARYRLRGFGLTMIVTGGGLILYYLGLFGTYEGPLTPNNIGHTLDDWGVSKSHIAWFFMALFILLLTWNWVFNTVSLLKGKRLSCRITEADGCCCGAKVSRNKIMDGKGNKSIRYICEKGHVATQAHFHSVKKGPWSYCLCLAMGLISGMCIYWI
ncbi:MAG: hypothetical protein KGY61_06410 [Desulfobacterales bacterium]|nr:hypothetical protein [Desulfobacterales bacterium]